jgi:hypothetical protein
MATPRRLRETPVAVETFGAGEFMPQRSEWNGKCGVGVVPEGYRVSIGAQFVRPDIKQSSSLPSA